MDTDYNQETRGLVYLVLKEASLGYTGGSLQDHDNLEVSILVQAHPAIMGFLNGSAVACPRGFHAIR